MLPVEEMRKLSQMVGIDDVDLDVPNAEAEQKDDEPKAEETPVEEATAEATVTIAPSAEPAPEAAEEQK